MVPIEVGKHWYRSLQLRLLGPPHLDEGRMRLVVVVGAGQSLL